MLHLLVISLLVSLIFFPSLASATTMSGEKYQMQLNPTNTPMLRPSPTPVRPQLKNQEASRPKPKFEPAISSLAIKLIETSIDFSLLEPATPLKRSTDLSVFSTTPFTLLGFQNHPPQDATGIAIPDTTCDSGTCNHKQTGSWESPLTFGSGYACMNKQHDPCVAKNFFRHFPNLSLGQEPVIIMQSNNAQDTSARIVFKINLSASQPALNYAHDVTLILFPKL